MNTAMIGLDIAKNVFQVYGVDQHGKPMLQRKLRRGEVLRFFAKLPPCLVGIEACHSSHFWGRELLRVSHNVRLIPTQYVNIAMHISDAASPITPILRRLGQMYLDQVDAVERWLGQLNAQLEEIFTHSEDCQLLA